LDRDATETEFKPDGTIVMTFNVATVTNKGGEDERSLYLFEHLRDALVPRYESVLIEHLLWRGAGHVECTPYALAQERAAHLLYFSRAST
jgi:hypothetical protein